MSDKYPNLSGKVTATWIDDGRMMQLENEVTFADKNGVKWIAEKGRIVDGASIPRFFWRLIGSPFVGRYRIPSVIHDVYCRKKVLKSKYVHKMFYECMLYCKVPWWKAWIMYQAVKQFGPTF